jgi:hypothetical protein
MIIIQQQGTQPKGYDQPFSEGWKYPLEYRFTCGSTVSAIGVVVRNQLESYYWFNKAVPVVESYFQKPCDDRFQIDNNYYYIYIRDKKDLITLKLLLP